MTPGNAVLRVCTIGGGGWGVARQVCGWYQTRASLSLSLYKYTHYTVLSMHDAGAVDETLTCRVSVAVRDHVLWSVGHIFLNVAQ